MIWFGNVNRLLPTPTADGFGPVSEDERMLRALRWAAERDPQLSRGALLDALALSGWVDRETAGRLLPAFRHFDADRHFSDHLRRLSFRGRSAGDDFRAGVRHVVHELVGNAELGEAGPEPAIRFRSGEREGIVLAYPEVGFNVSGATREGILAALEEMPDALIVVARNFERNAADQLRSILHRTEVPGTLLTLNLLLGLRAVKLRYCPASERVVDLLGSGRPLRSADVARLGDRI